MGKKKELIFTIVGIFSLACFFIYNISNNVRENNEAAAVFYNSELNEMIFGVTVIDKADHIGIKSEVRVILPQNLEVFDENTKENLPVRDLIEIGDSIVKEPNSMQYVLKLKNRKPIIVN